MDKKSIDSHGPEFHKILRLVRKYKDNKSLMRKKDVMNLFNSNTFSDASDMTLYLYDHLMKKGMKNSVFGDLKRNDLESQLKKEFIDFR